MLRSNLCDYTNAYIVLKGILIFDLLAAGGIDLLAAGGIDLLAAGGNENKAEKHFPCISKINNTLIDNTEDLDIAKPMYNLLEYSQNNSMTSRSLWNYYRDGIGKITD